jgi:hypothetical protein
MSESSITTPKQMKVRLFFLGIRLPVAYITETESNAYRYRYLSSKQTDKLPVCTGRSFHFQMYARSENAVAYTRGHWDITQHSDRKKFRGTNTLSGTISLKN